ncbi:hypothetical protein NQ315_013203 [Exocentrus adspersus]|uniref:Reverse transcriptase domain-containing protein n=1 Tax=Exocentrus adspersus TaxID=1586481 RepID=A0AAV8VD33_9CUCU|nr:hypothetical protein NQ315_013203 [Exocentrus adspersus]
MNQSEEAMREPIKKKKLIQKKGERAQVDPTKTVINLSSKILDQNQINLLNRGLKFTMAPRSIPRIELMMTAEETASQMEDAERAEEYRWKIRTVLERADYKPRKNISAESTALKDLQSDLSIKILPADKGNATVVLDLEIYNKIQEMMEQGQYKKLRKDPTSSIEIKEGITTSAVKNTHHFGEIIREQHITQQDPLVSFDVTSLFTNVPTNKALDIVKKKLSEDQALEHRTSLSINMIMEMLNMCINTTYFQLYNDFYQQEFSVAMGSPLLPIVSNIFIGDIVT